MEAAARVTCKGQITIPKIIREALGVEDGDHVVFRVEGERAIIARTPNLLDMAGLIAGPAPTRGTSWDDVVARARASRTRSGAADLRAGVRSSGAKAASEHAKSTPTSSAKGTRSRSIDAVSSRS
jgi:AbrB family looped-hinge helix DNA binding protein